MFFAFPWEKYKAHMCGHAGLRYNNMYFISDAGYDDVCLDN